MNRPGDDDPDMTMTRGDLDERAIDALFHSPGRAVHGDFQDVAVLFRRLRDSVDVPAGPPSAELAAMLASGLPPGPPQARQSAPVSRPALWYRGRRAATAVALSALLVVPTVGFAAAQDRLPGWAQEAVEDLIEMFTPFALPGQRSPSAPGPDAGEPSSPEDRSEPAGVPSVVGEPVTGDSRLSEDDPDGAGTGGAGTGGAGTDAPVGVADADQPVPQQTDPDRTGASSTATPAPQQTAGPAATSSPSPAAASAYPTPAGSVATDATAPPVGGEPAGTPAPTPAPDQARPDSAWGSQVP